MKGLPPSVQEPQTGSDNAVPCLDGLLKTVMTTSNKRYRTFISCTAILLNMLYKVVPTLNGM